MQGRFKRNQQQISGRFGATNWDRGEAWVTLAPRKQPFLLSPLKMYTQLGAACFSSFHQYRQHGEQNGD
jgi:hypothetical protein